MADGKRVLLMVMGTALLGVAALLLVWLLWFSWVLFHNPQDAGFLATAAGMVDRSAELLSGTANGREFQLALTPLGLRLVLLLVGAMFLLAFGGIFQALVRGGVTLLGVAARVAPAR